MSVTDIEQWIAPRKILLATDLTDLKHTLPVAIGDATRHGAELLIAHVLAGPGSMQADPTLLVYAEADKLAEDARMQLAEAAGQARAAGARCSFTLAKGRVVDELLKLAAEWNADRIVAGTRGSAKFQRHILGSVAASLFHHMEIPVLAAPPKDTAGARGSGTVQRILLAAPLDRSGERLARFGLSIAESASAEIMLLHVLPSSSQAHPMTEKAELYTEMLLTELTKLICVRRCHPVCAIGHGDPVEQIVERATTGKAELIILGASTHTAFSGRFLPGTAYRVLCDAPCPVLVLKHKSTWETAGGLEQHETPVLGPVSTTPMML